MASILVSLDSWRLLLAMVKNLPLYKKQWCYSFACAIKIHQKYVKAILAGALGYLVLPIDIIPDTIAGLAG